MRDARCSALSPLQLLQPAATDAWRGHIFWSLAWSPEPSSRSRSTATSTDTFVAGEHESTTASCIWRSHSCSAGRGESVITSIAPALLSSLFSFVKETSLSNGLVEVIHGAISFHCHVLNIAAPESGSAWLVLRVSLWYSLLLCLFIQPLELHHSPLGAWTTELNLLLLRCGIFVYSLSL